MTALDRPRVLATLRSISPVTITSVIGRATSAIGNRSRTRKPKFWPVPKLSTLAAATISTSTVIATIATFQLAQLSWRPRVSVSSADMGASLLQTGRDPDGDQPVRADREQDQAADDRLLPELVDLEDGERTADRCQQQRA